MEIVVKQFSTSVINDEFTIPPSIGTGFFKQYSPLTWLTLAYISFAAYEPITMIRRSVKNSKWLPVMFYINEHTYSGPWSATLHNHLQESLVACAFPEYTRPFVKANILTDKLFRSIVGHHLVK